MTKKPPIKSYSRNVHLYPKKMITELKNVQTMKNRGKYNKNEMKRTQTEVVVPTPYIFEDFKRE